jgi:hypothetical protein
MSEPVAYRGWENGKPSLIVVNYDENNMGTLNREDLETLLYGMAYFDD